VEARTSEQKVREAFARIEVAVDGGNRDLRALGFWRLVAGVKRDPAVADRWADQVGRIDEKAFRAGVRVRAPVWVGNLILLSGVGAGAACIVVARAATSEVVAGVALILAGGLWSVSTHCIAHWLVGRTVGIRFSNYFVAGFPPRPGLKTEYASYLRADASARALMHASGAIATKLSPFVALVFWPGTEAPWWAAAGLLALGVLQIVTDVLFSVRSGDWRKVKRERAIARAAAGGHR
jgi:hypothetical protein